MNANYKCITTVKGIRDYIGEATIVAFDYETAPNEAYRTEDKAAIDAHLAACGIPVLHTAIFRSEKAAINPSEIDPVRYSDWLKRYTR